MLVLCQASCRDLGVNDKPGVPNKNDECYNRGKYAVPEGYKREQLSWGGRTVKQSTPFQFFI